MNRRASLTHARASWRGSAGRRSRAGRANETASSTTATAAAPAGSPLWMRLKMKTDATSVLYGRFPEMSDERADLADGARERERDAGEDPREDVRQDDAAEDARLGGAERARRLLHLACRARAAPAARCGRRTAA